MRNIKYIVLHCKATPQNTTIDSIKRYWKNNLGWKSYGYHYIIEPSGNVVQITPDDKIANGVKGYNRESIHISYIGGRKIDDRTDAQKKSQLKLIKQLKEKYATAEILGHRDFPNVNKLCPNFDVKQWLKDENVE